MMTAGGDISQENADLPNVCVCVGGLFCDPAALGKRQDTVINSVMG